MRSKPHLVYFNPPGCSWYNAAEWCNSILKAHVAKAFATMKSDITNEAEIRSFIWLELEKVRKKLKGSRLIYSIVPELEKALQDAE